MSCYSYTLSLAHTRTHTHTHARAKHLETNITRYNRLTGSKTETEPQNNTPKSTNFNLILILFDSFVMPCNENLHQIELQQGNKSRKSGKK